MRLSLAALLLSLVFVTGGASAAEEKTSSPKQQLEQVQKDLQETTQRRDSARKISESLDQEVSDLQQKLVDASKALDASENELDQLETGLADLEGAAERKQKEVDQRKDEMAELLALIQRTALIPDATQLLAPRKPLERLRTDMQVRELIPELQRKGEEIASLARDLDHLRRTMTERRQAVLHQRETLDVQKRELADLVGQRAAQLESSRKQTKEEETRLARLAAKATSLQNLMDELERDRTRQLQEEENARAREHHESRDKARKEAEETASASASESEGEKESDSPLSVSLPARALPVRGVILSTFGTKDSYGLATKGLSIKTRPEAQVVSVAAGKIAFAGPFRGYGNMLVIEHSGGFHSIVAGLGSLSVRVGQKVVAGEPLGKMGEEKSPAPQLYFEVRLNGTPINPESQSAQKLFK